MVTLQQSCSCKHNNIISDVKFPKWDCIQFIYSCHYLWYAIALVCYYHPLSSGCRGNCMHQNHIVRFCLLARKTQIDVEVYTCWECVFQMDYCSTDDIINSIFVHHLNLQINNCVTNIWYQKIADVIGLCVMMLALVVIHSTQDWKALLQQCYRDLSQHHLHTHFWDHHMYLHIYSIL